MLFLISEAVPLPMSLLPNVSYREAKSCLQRGPWHNSWRGQKKAPHEHHTPFFLPSKMRRQTPPLLATPPKSLFPHGAIHPPGLTSLTTVTQSTSVPVASHTYLLRVKHFIMISDIGSFVWYLAPSIWLPPMFNGNINCLECCLCS